MAAHDLGIVSSNEKIHKLCREIATEYNYSVRTWKNLDEFVGGPEDCLYIVAEPANPDSASSITETAQAIKQLGNNPALACVIGRMKDADDLEFLRKSGANLIVLASEVETTSRIEFSITQTLSSSYHPIKATDLEPGVPLTFDLFHLMPQRRKFLPFAFVGDNLTADKVTKLHEIGEFYIRRQDVARFQQYVNALAQGSRQAFIRRSRAQFLMLASAYGDLVLNLTDRSGHASFQKGTEMFENVSRIADELLICLGSGHKGNSSDMWEVINQSAIETFGSIERAPAVASYAALMGLTLNQGDLKNLMIGALMADVGLLFLAPSTCRKIRRGELATLKDDELKAYRQYPLSSLSAILERKIGLPEKLRTILTAKFECADGSGFPKGLKGGKIPIESQLIQLADMLDQRTRIQFGRPRIAMKDAWREIMAREMSEMKRFSPKLMEDVKVFFAN